ncbi:MAG TPA: response regulator [Nitrospirae bacterium]|nr:transcriptional regulatory protein WalR [bacterium BMS3Abin09]GBE41456.1 transcriptional regulatory protein WalR [bacterium BMS3Bbin09]HDH34007.1 response regulator [Nitrospirota bacterium]HDO66977.1 response regulator [Nitrospirota bacterium]HDZ84866.1 response regulator [Nitrospirota bacterium]
MRAKILVVDDEKDILELVAYNLRKEGYDVLTSWDGEEALKLIKKERYSLIILDLMLPGIQGMELCKMLKSSEDNSTIPIIMLTAKSEELDKVLGLEMGADDYITKPFSPRELVARVKAVLRRTREVPVKDKLVNIADLEINTDTYKVMKRGKEIKLSATEFRLLIFLVRRKGRVFNRDMLLDAVWKDEAFVEPRTVDVHIRRLRTQIEDDPSNPIYIKTRRGIGYYVDGEL